MRTRSRQSGFTFIELLIVLAIVGILAVAGNYITTPRQKPAVQNLLSEVEGIVFEAHKYSGATLGNVAIVATPGAWAKGNPTPTIWFRQVSAPTVVVRGLSFDGFPDTRFARLDAAGTDMGKAVGSETLEAAIASSPDLIAQIGPALPSTNNLFLTGGGAVEVNAFNKQFLAPFHIAVVGLRDGETYLGAPAGYIIVNGNSIYKFFKAGPGPTNPWRRL